MYDLIRRIAEWLRLLLAPGAGVHRRTARSPCRVLLRRLGAARARRVVLRLAGPRPPVRLRLLRSQYDVSTPFEGAVAAHVPPCLAVHEGERARQARRRLALVLAADFGVDLDQHLIGAREVAA